LHAAHLAGLVHRDIKPANILLDRQGVIRILDLGLARFFSDDQDPLTLKYDGDSVLGTADYVAPEQALNSHDVDIRADIYGLGATFYFLLVGHPLFPDGQLAQKLIWHQTRRPTPVRQLRPEVPAEVAAIVECMIEKDPARRYPTPAEVIEALAVWTQTPVAPPAEGEMPRLSPAARAAAVADSGSNIPRRPRSMAELPAPPFPTQVNLPKRSVAASGVPIAEPVPMHPSGRLTAQTGNRLSSSMRRRLFVLVLFVGTATLTGIGVRWVMNQSPRSSTAEPSPIVTPPDGAKR
jgi:serine/threonine protein kinase